MPVPRTSGVNARSRATSASRSASIVSDTPSDCVMPISSAARASSAMHQRVDVAGQAALLLRLRRRQVLDDAGRL